MLPFYKFLSRHDIFLITRYSTKWSTIPVEFSARLYVFFFFYICFCSLLINTRLVFISYFVSVPLRNDHRGLEYQCSFVCLSLFLFAFLIISIETFGFSWIFITLPPSFPKTGPQSDIQDSGVSEEQQRKIIYKRYSI